MKITSALSMALSLPVTLCTMALSHGKLLKDPAPHILDSCQFRALIETGTAIRKVMHYDKDYRKSGIDESRKVDIEQPKHKVVSVDGIAMNNTDFSLIRVFQPVHIIDGAMFIVDHCQKYDDDTGQLSKINGVHNVAETALMDLFKECQPVDLKFPIILRTLDTEILSLGNLVEPFCSCTSEFIAKGKKFTREAFRLLTSKWKEIPSKIPEWYEKIVHIVESKLKWPFNYDRRTFDQAIEGLFYQMRLLYQEREGENYREEKFLEKILPIYKEAQEVYKKVAKDRKRNANKERINQIKKYLNDPKTRELMAKALILDAFHFTDVPKFDLGTDLKLIINNIMLVLYQKYGHLASLLEHMSPHLAPAGEELELFYREKSVVLLKKNITNVKYAQWLSKIVSDDAIPKVDGKQLDMAYRVGDVKVRERKDKEDNEGRLSIAIEITLNKKFQDELVHNMLSNDGMGNLNRASKMLWVLQAEDGSFYLRTAYPIKSTNEGNISFESDEEYKSKIYNIYSNVFLSKTLQAKNTEDSIILRVDDFTCR